jgi:hypothetical protein
MVAVKRPLRIVWVFSLVFEPYPHAGRMGSSRPSISQRCHECAQRRRVNCARDPHPSPGRELNLDRTAASAGRSQRLPVGRNGHCRKTDFAILPLHRLRAARAPVRACRRQAVTRLR